MDKQLSQTMRRNNGIVHINVQEILGNDQFFKFRISCSPEVAYHDIETEEFTNYRMEAG